MLVDSSASVVRRRPGWLPWIRARLADEATLADENGSEIAVVVFGRDVDLRFAPAAPQALIAALEARGGAPFDPAASDDGESALTGAVEVASSIALDPLRPAGAVVLLGDGAWTGTDPARALAALAWGGAEFSHVLPPPATLPDAAVVSLDLPDLVEVGAPLLARVTLELSPPGAQNGVLIVEVDGGGGVRADAIPFQAPPASATSGIGANQAPANRVVLPVDLGPADYGRTAVSVHAVLAGREAGGNGGDVVPENDRAEAVTVAEGELVCGAVSSIASRAVLQEWIARDGADVFPGVQVLPLSPEEVPGVLDQLDLLVSFDIPIDVLPAELVEPFVRRGGGWLAVSGWGFLEDWSPGGAEEGLHALLPVRPAPVDVGPRDVVVLVDGSGSMAGEPFDLVRTAAVEMVAAALPRDEIHLRFFTKVLEQPHVLRARGADPSDRGATREAAARKLLAARVPGGSTWILASLEQLAEERERLSRDALILLLTDGQESGSSPDPGAKATSLATRLRAAKARLRVIAVGADADLKFLGRLVSPGEEVVVAKDLAELEQIFQREVNRARTTDAEDAEGLLVVRHRGEPGSLADELLAPMGAPPLPSLERLVRDELRPGATLLWATEDGDPVLAARRVGLGRAAVFASAPRAAWGSAWIGEAERFGPLLRWLGRGRRRGGPSARIDEGRLLLEGLEGDWPPIVSAALVDPLARGGERTEVELVLAPLHPLDAGTTRRRVSLSPELIGASAGSVMSLLLEVPPGAATAPGPLALTVEVPIAPEFRPTPGLRLRAASADGADPGAGGGKERRDSASLDVGETVSAFGPPLLISGLGLLLLAGLARRLTQGSRTPGR